MYGSCYPVNFGFPQSSKGPHLATVFIAHILTERERELGSKAES